MSVSAPNTTSPTMWRTRCGFGWSASTTKTAEITSRHDSSQRWRDVRSVLLPRNWLGRYCYQPDVVSSGLWNQQHTAGPPITADELAEFEQLAQRSRPAATPAHRATDLPDTLLVIPCCSSIRERAATSLAPRQVTDFLPSSAIAVLEEGREQAFKRPKVSLDDRSPLVPAIDLYTGQPNATLGLRQQLTRALEDGMHCLIISGGYGLVRPEEPIHDYKAHLAQHTRTVWRKRFPTLLSAYVEQNEIQRAFVGLSSTYAQCLPTGSPPTSGGRYPPSTRTPTTAQHSASCPPRSGNSSQACWPPT